MEERSPKYVKSAAAQCLQQSKYDPRRLVGIHSAVGLGAGILSALISLVVNIMIENTGGLGDLGTRAVLGTVGGSVNAIVALLLPFWNIGFTYCAIRLARQEKTAPADLLQGLRRWGVVLRQSLCQALVYIAVAVLALQLGSYIYLLTPGSTAVLEQMNALISDPAFLEGAFDPAAMESLLLKMIPAYVISGGILALLGIPLAYRLRMASWRIMDNERPGAIRSLMQSSVMMRHNRFSLFKLDLSFWWFYLLQLLFTGFVYLPELLGLAGVTIPGNPDLVYLLCYLLYAVATWLLQSRFLAQIQTAYGLFYDRLLQQHKPPVPTEDPPANDL